jgi:hypothetical protein
MTHSRLLPLQIGEQCCPGLFCEVQQGGHCIQVAHVTHPVCNVTSVLRGVNSVVTEFMVRMLHGKLAAV